MIVTPALDTAVIDDRVKHSDLRVLWVMHRDLDFREFRPLKLVVIGYRVKIRGRPMKVTNVGRSLRHLTSLGYVERQKEQGQFTYRLVFSAPPIPPFEISPEITSHVA